MKKTFSFAFIAIAMIITAGLSSCVKQEFDEPPASDIPVGDVLTIAQLRQMYADSSEYTFEGDYSVYATVTMDESTGNIYRTAFIQDDTDATYLFFDNSGGVTEGDSIRLFLDGCTLSEYGGVFQVKDVDNDSSIVIIENERYLEPEVVTMAQLVTGIYESKLVKVTDVQFANSELGKTWAENSDYGNRTFEDENENTAIVRTSSYASFAEDVLPEGSGSMVGIASRYNETIQFYVRSLTEVDMTGDRFGNGSGGGGSVEPVASVDEDFNGETAYEDIAVDGWTNITVVGDRKWQGKEYNSDVYAQATGYNSGLDAMETWLITPPVINTNGDRILNFQSAQAYWSHSGDPMTVLVSTDFVGDNFETASWTEINVTLATSSTPEHEWVESGEVNLSAYTGNVAVAFKYVGSDTESTSMRIDNVTIDDGNGGGGGGGGTIEPVESLFQDFSGETNYSDIAAEGWTNIAVEGSRKWQAKEFDSDIYAQATGYNSGLDAIETWLITPPVVNTNGDKVLSFRSAMAYWTHSGNPVEVLVSTDFNGENFETANWETIDVVLAESTSGDHTWIPSGDYSLSAYTGNVAVAFKYVGSDSESTSFRFDDVSVQ